VDASESAAFSEAIRVCTDRAGIGRVFFSADAALREEPDRRGDHKGSARSRERGAERLDCEPVRLAAAAMFEKS